MHNGRTHIPGVRSRAAINQTGAATLGIEHGRLDSTARHVQKNSNGPASPSRSKLLVALSTTSTNGGTSRLPPEIRATIGERKIVTLACSWVANVLVESPSDPPIGTTPIPSDTGSTVPPGGSRLDGWGLTLSLEQSSSRLKRLGPRPRLALPAREPRCGGGGETYGGSRLECGNHRAAHAATAAMLMLLPRVPPQRHAESMCPATGGAPAECACTVAGARAGCA